MTEDGLYMEAKKQKRTNSLDFLDLTDNYFLNGVLEVLKFPEIFSFNSDYFKILQFLGKIEKSPKI